jgi:hypothetical protein
LLLAFFNFYFFLITGIAVVVLSVVWLDLLQMDGVVLSLVKEVA